MCSSSHQYTLYIYDTSKTSTLKKIQNDSQQLISSKNETEKSIFLKIAYNFTHSFSKDESFQSQTLVELLAAKFKNADH